MLIYIYILCFLCLIQTSSSSAPPSPPPPPHNCNTICHICSYFTFINFVPCAGYLCVCCIVFALANNSKQPAINIIFTNAAQQEKKRSKKYAQTTVENKKFENSYVSLVGARVEKIPEIYEEKNRQ